jgi:hypothetical protein
MQVRLAVGLSMTKAGYLPERESTPDSPLGSPISRAVTVHPSQRIMR